QGDASPQPERSSRFPPSVRFEGAFRRPQGGTCETFTPAHQADVPLRSSPLNPSWRAPATRLWSGRGHGVSSAVLTKAPMRLVWAPRSCSSCLWPRRRRYSMSRTSVRGIWAFFRNSDRIRGRKPGLPLLARTKLRYRLSTRLCSSLWRPMGPGRTGEAGRRSARGLGARRIVTTVRAAAPRNPTEWRPQPSF
uniref:Uncharacterized protein n=1 Tax=Varanus komodoensis TaxID=61221 RepID=A0A8D2IGS0_VARKO